MAQIKQLMTVQQWDEALQGTSSKPLLVFKHSTSCPISAGAHEEFIHYVEDREDRIRSISRSFT